MKTVEIFETYLLRTDPPQLRVRDEEVPGLAHVREELLNLLALDSLGDESNSSTDLYTSSNSRDKISTSYSGAWREAKVGNGGKAGEERTIS
jgi:hypothetical protein